MSCAQISLDGKWKLTFFEQTSRNPICLTELKKHTTIDCMVPGNVELDLSNAGYLPKDLYMGENLALAEKFETFEWWYQTEFDCAFSKENGKIYLKFDAVDCFAEYYLNDVLIGESKNALIPHEFDVTNCFKQKGNKLIIRIRSAMLEENDIPTTLFSANANWQKWAHSSSVRKAPHSYGWDIMPRAVSAGIWRSVYITQKPSAYFNQLYLYTDSLNKNYANLRLVYELHLPYGMYNKGIDKKIKIQGKCNNSTFEKTFDIQFKSGNERITIDNPQLWWPFGYGDANLYDVKATFIANGEEITTQSFSFGLRTVVLEKTDTTDGVSGYFRFKINDTEIMAKGSNWVPMDAFHSRDKERYAKAFELVKDIGCNILRCWGGNVYEDDEFFDFCDKNGVMVWQDFSMACYTYPRTDEFCALMKNEATVIVKKLRQHPSIIAWAGDNECDMSLSEGFNQNSFNPNTVNKLTRTIIPDVIIDNDCGRPYIPSSPFVSDEVYYKKNYKLMSEDHIWGPRDYFKSDFYKHSNSHFVSETGYHGCPSPDSIRKFITDDSIWPYENNSQWTFHSSDQKGNPSKIDRIVLMANQLTQLYGYIPDNLEEFSFLSQLSQAEAKKYFIERVRIHRPEKSGVVWWNLLDGWPQFSDAVVDYYYDKKIAYDYIKVSQQPFCIFCDEVIDGIQNIVASNDTLENASGSFSVEDGETGEILLDGNFKIGKNQNSILGSLSNNYSSKRLLIIKWDINGKKGANHYICGFIPFDAETHKKWHKIITDKVLKK